MNKILFMLLSILLFSCTNKEMKSKKQQIEVAYESNEERLKVNLNHEEKLKTAKIDSTLVLKFDEVNLKLNVFDIFSKRQVFDKIYQDTIIINWGLGERFENKKFLIEKIDTTISKVEVFQSYKTALSVTEEGAHLDLVNWKTYQSPWKQLTIVNQSFFLISYSKEEQEKFPKVTNAQILKIVKKRVRHNDNKFMIRAKDCKSANTYPCVVGISEVGIKLVIYTNDKNPIIKIIRIIMPMGC